MTILQPDSGLYIAGHYTGRTSHYTGHTGHYTGHNGHYTGHNGHYIHEHSDARYNKRKQFSLYKKV